MKTAKFLAMFLPIVLASGLLYAITYQDRQNPTNRIPVGLRIEPAVDINRDGVVNIVDIVIAALAFGSKSGDPNWNPDADLKPDGVIDICDLVTIAINFGKTL